MRRLHGLIPDDEGGDRYLPLVIAAMVFLAELAMATGLTLDSAARTWRSDLAGKLTIEIPVTDAVGEPKDVRAKTVADIMRQFPGITSVQVLSDAEVNKLLEPWLGNAAAVHELPLPALIDLEIETEIDINALAETVAQADPAATLDDHGLWLARLLRFVHAARLLAVAMVALAAGALCLTVIFGTRAGLAAHRDVVELLHLVGARDETIAQRFLMHSLVLGLRGAFLGLAFAAAALYGLSRLASDIDSPLITDLTLTSHQIVALVVLPFLAAILSAITARWTVMRTLARMP
jgi:cell division transport system permease protein